MKKPVLVGASVLATAGVLLVVLTSMSAPSAASTARVADDCDTASADQAELSATAESSAPEIDTYVHSLGRVRTQPLPAPSDWTLSNGQWVRGAVKAQQFEQLVALDPNPAQIYPGSMLRGNSLSGAYLSSVALPLAPVELTISNVEGKMVGACRYPMHTIVQHPTQASVDSAISALLPHADPKSTVPSISYSEQEFDDVRQVLFHLGVSASAMSAEVKASLDSDSYSHRHNLAIDMVQRYYSVSASPLRTPAAAFAKDVSLAEVESYANASNPPVVVSNVAYGRRVVLLLSSEASIDELRAAVRATYDAMTASGSVEMSVHNKEVLSKSELRVYIAGGGANSAIGVISANQLIPALRGYFKQGAEFSASSPGSVLSFRANYLDNTVADVQLQTEEKQTAPATRKHYLLRWYNHFAPSASLCVNRNMETDRWGGDHNANYYPYVTACPAIPVNAKQTEVAGDEQFKGGAPNFWVAAPYNLPSLMERGLQVMDDERFFLVEYDEDLPKPAA